VDIGNKLINFVGIGGNMQYASLAWGMDAPGNMHPGWLL